MTTKQLIADTLPSGWKIGKLKYFYKFETGFTPPTTRPEYYTPDGEMWVTIADMCNSEVTSSKNRISKLYADSIKAKKVPRGSLLYSFKLSLGKTSIAGCDTYTNEAIASFSSEKNPCINFLKYSSCMIEDNALENIYGAKLLNRERIENAIIVFPPIKTQERIAEYLDKRCSRIDECIKKLQAQLQLVSSYRQSLITRAVTKGLDGDHQTSFIPLKYLAKLNPDVEQAMSDEIEYLPMEKVKNGMFLHHSDKLANLPPSLNSFEDGDILLAKVTPCFENGNICLAENCKGGVGRCSTELFVLRPNPQKVMPKFLMLLLQTQSFKQEAACQMRGTGGLKRIPADWLCNYKFPIPSLEKQKQIVEYMASKHSNLDGLTKKIKDSICLLNDYRSSLISAAVTGQLAIEEAEE